MDSALLSTSYSSLAGQAHDYMPLSDGVSVPIDSFEVEQTAQARKSSHGESSAADFMFGENRRWQPPADLDTFFQKVYRYYCEKGFLCMLTQWVVELLTLGFTIAFSAFLLLWVDWSGLLSAKCGIAATEENIPPCDLAIEALYAHPLKPLTLHRVLVLGYLVIFSCYWMHCCLRFLSQLKELLTVRDFVNNSLGISEKELQSMAWPVLVDKMVVLQSRKRLCVARDLSPHDMVSRMMRKDNYLIGMLNKGVLAMRIPKWLPGAGPASGGEASAASESLLLTKTLEWTLQWCIFDHMFDENFCVRREFLKDPKELRHRFRLVALAMLVLSPFLSIFMFMYFFLRNAEQFYHQPSSAGSRRWSNLAYWKFREFNELDHLFKHRLNPSYRQAVDYTKQFPSPLTSMIAKLVAFVSASFAAVLLGIALMDETLLEAHIFGRNLFWYAAVLGTVVAVSRSLVTEEYGVFDPQGLLQRVVHHTHYLPKHWRGAAATEAVRAEFESLFQLKALLFLQEIVSILVTPCLLWFYLPQNVDRVLQFVQDFTVHVEGVGHVCSLSVFDFSSHGNSKYGSPCHVSKDQRSSQGKMEKSFLGFKHQYPNWEPDPNGKLFLSRIAHLEHREPPPPSVDSQFLNASEQPPTFSLSTSYPFPDMATATPRPNPSPLSGRTGGILSPSHSPTHQFEPQSGFGSGEDAGASTQGSLSVSSDHSDVGPLRPMRARHVAVPREESDSPSVTYESVQQFFSLDKYNTAASTDSFGGVSVGRGRGGVESPSLMNSVGTDAGFGLAEAHMRGGIGEGSWGGRGGGPSFVTSFRDGGLGRVTVGGREEAGLGETRGRGSSSEESDEGEKEREWVTRRQLSGGGGGGGVGGGAGTGRTIHQRLISAGAIGLPGLTTQGTLSGLGGGGGKWEEEGRKSPPLLFGDVYDKNLPSAEGRTF